MPGLRGHHDPLPLAASGRPVTKDRPHIGAEVLDQAGAVSRAPDLDIDLMTAREVEAIKVMPGAKKTGTMSRLGGEDHPGVHLGGRHQCPRLEAGQTEPVRGRDHDHQSVL